MSQAQYPRRLIEVDLPIRRISFHALREKSREGHISTLHIWWARRPLAACRAVICAALWPDPADPLCPPAFLEVAQREMLSWTTHERQAQLSEESRKLFERTRKNNNIFNDKHELRAALLDFIADFADWSNSTALEYLRSARILTIAAHQSLGGASGTRPLIVDPFAGGGSIPLEALRVGADAFASDLNPVPVLLNKLVLEYIPKFGQRLADEIRRRGKLLINDAKKRLSDFYPDDLDGAKPVAYLWARTIQCEGPGCGARIPVSRSLWIDQSRGRRAAIELHVSKDKRAVTPKVRLEPKESDVQQGTSKRSSVTCPCCGYTTPRQRVEAQAKSKGLGQMLMAVAIQKSGARSYRSASTRDLEICAAAEDALTAPEIQALLPDEVLPYLRSIFNVHVYGMQTWRSLFSPRQLLFLTTLVRLVRQSDYTDQSLAKDEEIAIKTALALIVSKSAMLSCNIARWRGDRGRLEGAFAMQALPMVWDWGELNPFNSSIMVLDDLVNTIATVVEHNASVTEGVGQVELSSAVSIPLPDDCAAAVITDPPYYDSIPYANLSDFFYVWLKRLLRNEHPRLFSDIETPKANEIVQLAERNPLYAHKTREFFETQMELAMTDARRVTEPSGIACVVFAHKTTAGWESLINAVLRAGWTVTASWPIDTEMATRFKAIGTASLSSSVHLICRPREDADGTLRAEQIGDWREVLQQLPRRIHEWMPRLADEGVVGADAIFACLGPALEIFSRFSRVEKANGEVVSLSEYLEQVWAAVAREALTMVFAGADATGFEPDARLTAMWLWTLNAAASNSDGAAPEDEIADEELEAGHTRPKIAEFVLEYDAVRKISQGLGADLESLRSVVEISGDKARLLPVSERAKYLFGRDEATKSVRTPTQKPKQADFFSELKAAEVPTDNFMKGALTHGSTVLDRVHQSMILFATGRSEALKRFLVEDGVGQEHGFWRLAQALSALYPSSTDEKRWVDGVLARKKGLGF